MKVDYNAQQKWNYKFWFCEEKQTKINQPYCILLYSAPTKTNVTSHISDWGRLKDDL